MAAAPGEAGAWPVRIKGGRTELIIYWLHGQREWQREIKFKTKCQGCWGRLQGAAGPGSPWAVRCGWVSSRVALPADVLFTFSFLQQLSVLVPGFVLGGGRICGYKTCTEASFRSERASLCAGRYFTLCSKFPFEKCQIILVNTVENPPALGLSQERKQWGAGVGKLLDEGAPSPLTAHMGLLRSHCGNQRGSCKRHM